MSGTLFHPDFASTHGCAWFEPSATGTRDMARCGGWYSIAGLPAKPFSSWKELSTDVVWWTNLTRAETWSLAKWDKIREGDLFGPDWSGWLAERASPEELALVPQICQGISETFARAGSWLAAWAIHSETATPWAWEGGSVADLLADRLGWREEESEGPQKIFEAAYAEEIRQLPTAQSLAGQRKIVLSFPRREHAQWLFRQRHPLGEWTSLAESAWPRDPEKHAHWLVEESPPLLVKVADISWRDTGEQAPMLWLGARGCRFAGAEREPIWMTGEEARVLSRHALFVIEAVYRCQGWGKTEVPAGFNLDRTDNPLIDLALSQELLASSLWRAAASPTREANNRRRGAFSPRAIWWRAYDRQRCFEAARRLMESGYRTHSYGAGQVVLIFDPSANPQDLARSILSAGLLLPGLLAQALPVPPNTMPENTLELDHWLKQVCTLEGRLDIDRLVAPWIGPAPVKPILQEAVKRLVSLKTPSQAWSGAWNEKLQSQARKSVDRLKASMSR